ncbi:MAG TPA: HEPN domain-containing protein [Blastocatellia bacterium]|nr:HEPN domain-containing protein [Blastocatellia bacterium]
MKNRTEAARRWFEQDVHSLAVTRVHVEKGFWSDACFRAEQPAQTALQVFLYGQDLRYIPVDSIAELATGAASIDVALAPVVEWGGNLLDKYSIPARYPDALAPPAGPYKSFTEEEVRPALDYAEQIIALVQPRLP